MDMYKDSILEELKAYSLMEYNLLRASKMEFTCLLYTSRCV